MTWSRAGCKAVALCEYEAKTFLAMCDTNFHLLQGTFLGGTGNLAYFFIM